ncbi:archease [Legionella maioricensis]|uniref:Archease n=1 Tax=Legionella maioricensis TaxID=2896528 RepID=A0A9X2D250_9GAMM|nr:archease [Legionella maioricensis]MCL9684929.1 archease [Legionella maioricensis]MCL9688239.1 archease [Legionella maioricensis]
MTVEKKWEHFIHEADIGVRGVGPTLPDAFEMGALALTNVITNSDAVKPVKSVHVSCEAPNQEILFTDWLNAIIYNMAIHNMLFSEFHITIENGTLEAIIKGEAVDRKRHQPIVEIKGATYTELKVVKKDEIWIAQCIVDV